MRLPKIDMSSLPEFDQVVGIFGGMTEKLAFCCDDTIIVVMVYVYDLTSG